MGKKTTMANPDKKSLFKRLFVDNKFIFIAFGCTAFVMIFIYYCYGLFPFGDVTILRMDLYHQYGPLFAELYERMVHLKSFLYSWNTGLGGSFLGNFYNYLSSPISLIILFFGHNNIPEAIAAMILIKAGLASSAFCYYLKRSQGKQNATTVAFGVLYSLCGFFIAYYWNVMWIDAMALFPLAMLGIELIIREKKAALFVFSLTMTFLSNYYMAYMLCIFSVIFYLVSYFSRYQMKDYYDGISATIVNGEKANYKLWDKIRYSRLIRSGLTFVFGSVLAVCLAAFALVPVYFILQGSSATTGTFPKDFNSYYKIFDFIANHLASVDPTIRSSGTDVLPNVYCGIATVILVPLYLFSKSISIREKAAHVALLGLLYFSFSVNIPNFIWHGFHFPNDLPYRFSFMYSFVLLIIAYKAFTRLKEFTGKEVLGSGVAILFGIVLIQELGSKNVVDLTIMISLCFVVLYTLIFALIRKDKYSESALAVLLLCTVLAEACVADTSRFSMSQTKTNYASDLSDFQTLKKSMDTYDGGFYRMELSDLRTRMDPSWYDYNGVSTFSSMANEKVANLQRKLGMAGNNINSYTYFPQTPIYNAMNSLKYVVNNDKSVPMNQNYYHKLMGMGKFTTYENRNYLPIAFCVDSSVTNWDYSSDNPFTVQADYFAKTTGVKDVFQKLEITDTNYYNVDEIYSGFDTGEFTFSKTASDSDASITFTITPAVTQSCYIYVRSDNVKTVNITSDDFSLTQDDNIQHIIDLGVRPAGVEIRIEMPITDGNTGNLDFYAYGLDQGKFTEGYNTLKTGQLDILKFEDTHILGSVKAAKDCVLYTSIPYDKGWTVKVDSKTIGEKDLVKVGNAMLGIKLAKGTRTIELTYMPQGLLPGVSISLTALLVLIIFLLLRSIFRDKRKKMNPVIHNEDTLSELPPLMSGSYSQADFDIDTPADPLFMPGTAASPYQFSDTDAATSSETPKGKEESADEPEIIVEKYDDE